MSKRGAAICQELHSHRVEAPGGADDELSEDVGRTDHDMPEMDHRRRHPGVGEAEHRGDGMVQKPADLGGLPVCCDALAP
jgi:hypothetical protein